MKIERTKLETTKGQGINMTMKNIVTFIENAIHSILFLIFLLFYCVCVGVCVRLPHKGPTGSKETLQENPRMGKIN